jgi:MerR family transcriptional regulator, copper efflux regulator
MNARLSIGLVARQTGCSVPTIRYYEEIGLLPPASRTAAGQRHYDDRTVRRLAFIRRCRDFGFTIEQVRDLAGLVDAPDRPCADVRDIAARHLEAVRGKLADLQALEASLGAVVGSCDAACATGATADCTLVDALVWPEPPRPGAARAPGCCA